MSCSNTQPLSNGSPFHNYIGCLRRDSMRGTHIKMINLSFFVQAKRERQRERERFLALLNEAPNFKLHSQWVQCKVSKYPRYPPDSTEHEPKLWSTIESVILDRFYDVRSSAKVRWQDPYWWGFPIQGRLIISPDRLNMFGSGRTECQSAFFFSFFFYLIRGAGWEGRMVRSCQIAIFSSHALDSDVVRSTVGRRPNLNLKMLSIFRWPSMGLLPSPNDASSSLQLLSSLSLLLLLANSLALVYA